MAPTRAERDSPTIWILICFYLARESNLVVPSHIHTNLHYTKETVTNFSEIQAEKCASEVGTFHVITFYELPLCPIEVIFSLR